MTQYLVTIALIFILLLGYVLVQQTYRLFARQHPELGPFRKEGGGCGCCSGGHCGETRCGDAPP